ncbi:MAG TPA: diguanylate cyclase [Gemmatimonadota bacterium]|jgi:diguanylate cyclase (GGDEF)-like protein
MTGSLPGPARRRPQAVPWKTVVAATAAVAIALLGWMDARTPSHVGIMIFHLGVLVAAATCLRERVVAALALAAGAAWLYADAVTAPEHPAWVWLWNGATRLVVFLTVGVGAVRLRRERRLVASLDARVGRAREREALESDPVTALASGAVWAERLEREVRRRRAESRPLSVVYVHVAPLREVNERLGGAGGDELLRRAAAALREAVRGADLAARVGGATFAVLLPDVGRQALPDLAVRVAEAVRQVSREFGEPAIRPCVSVVFADPPPDREELTRAAEDLLARAASAPDAVAIRFLEPRRPPGSAAPQAG